MFQLLEGDCREYLQNLINDGIQADLIVTSPPYDDMRSYGNTLEWNLDICKEIIKLLFNIIKPGGIVVWVVGDKTKNGSETTTSFKQALAFVEAGFKLNDTMIWCLSGGEYLYVKSQKGVSPMMIKDMVKLNPSDIQLWNGYKWVNIIGWKENKNFDKKNRIQLRSGENIYCTKEHRWILENNEEVLTKDLKVGDVLKTCTLPDDGSHSPYILTKDILWLLGLYIAEGSHSEDTIQFSLCADEIKWVDRIRNAIESVGGTVTYDIKDNTLNVRCYSKIFNAILSQYIGGKTSKNKHLNSICWKLSNENLKEIVNGYLDGDGGYDEKNNRWRLGFTENPYLERDLRVLSARLNTKLTLLRKGSRIKSLNKTYPSIKGEWKWENTNHYNEKKYSEILSITEEKARSDEHMWDIEVESEDHLFSLASGILTHNCKTNPLPQVKQPRYNQVFEYMFVFSKGTPKTFNPIMIPCKCAGMEYDSTCKNIGGEDGRTHKNFNINKEKVKDNVWEIAVAQNKTNHPAVFPEKLAHDHILTWSNEGDLVLDPFMGSGTTGIAAIKLNRNFIGIEKVKEYVELSKERILDAQK